MTWHPPMTKMTNRGVTPGPSHPTSYPKLFLNFWPPLSTHLAVEVLSTKIILHEFFFGNLLLCPSRRIASGVKRLGRRLNGTTTRTSGLHNSVYFVTPTIPSRILSPRFLCRSIRSFFFTFYATLSHSCFFSLVKNVNTIYLFNKLLFLLFFFILLRT